MKRLLLSILVLATGFGVMQLWQNSTAIKGDVVFGVLSDTHIDGSVNRTKALRSIVGELNRLKLDFVVELGDAVEGDTTAENLTQQFGLFRRGYDQLKVPHYYVRGNHDIIKGWTYQQVADWWRSHSPNPTYYSFDVKGYHFIMLEIPLGYPLPVGELEWLKNDLANTPYKTIVFSHRPIVWNPAVTWFKDPDVDPEVRSILEQSGKVLACFNGHAHDDVPGITLNGISYNLVPSAYFHGKYFVVSITGDKETVIRRSP